MEDFGTVQWNGKTYYLTQQAYASGTWDNPIYKANAINVHDEEYEITWDCINSLSEDEHDACDWENPISVREL